MNLQAILQFQTPPIMPYNPPLQNDLHDKIIFCNCLKDEELKYLFPTVISVHKEQVLEFNSNKKFHSDLSN